MWQNCRGWIRHIGRKGKAGGGEFLIMLRSTMGAPFRRQLLRSSLVNIGRLHANKAAKAEPL